MADLSPTAANVLASATATKRAYTAGATLTAGLWVYLDPVTNTVKLADANGTSPAFNVLGITLNGAASGQPVLVATLDVAGLILGATLTVGEIIVLSATPGAACPVADLSSGYHVTILGVAITTTKLMFSPLASGVAIP